MRTFILILCINLMIGCHPKNLGPRGDVIGNGGDGITGYWKMTKYEVKGRDMPLDNVSQMSFLKTQIGFMQTDSLKTPFYKQGTGYRIFSFYDVNMDSTSRYLGILYDYWYNKKTKQSAFYYRMDETNGFLAVIDQDVTAGLTTKIKLSNLMKSTVYKPELDTLGYTYEPTAKFE
ncbi:hypothetical protein [Dyadobacter chenhuakuii]|uniref:Lipocalin-like protein n=1 Tax=Dyadobacter chenhuakuii TaxID=2909339 RepID=A0ABY4XNS9_9BACT|nr:hypothetical protein [Dyadobacter chenhuakuii]MCF2494956.1 hypothetical protein [Dyadobacter chenhuakuii]USJ31728.1 hypothetical protein NFI80_03105 [Dyadobacter chenhuakuii]